MKLCHLPDFKLLFSIRRSEMHFVTFLGFSLANFWRAVCICSFSDSLFLSLEAGEFTTKFVKFAYGLGLRCCCSCGTSVCVWCVCGWGVCIFYLL